MSFSHRTKFLFIGSDKTGSRAVLINMTTVEKTERLSPLEKFGVLAGEIDQIRQLINNFQSEQCVDDLLETLEMAELGEKFGVTPETMRKKLIEAGGGVFKLGKKYVIRKVRFLSVLEFLETNL